MKSIASLLTVIAATILVGCSTTASHRDTAGIPATDITVSVTCSEPSMKFTGTIVADGHMERFSGIGSGIFHASGHELVCSFEKAGDDGRISLAVSESGKTLGNSSTADKQGGVRAEFARSLLARSDVFTTN